MNKLLLAVALYGLLAVTNAQPAQKQCVQNSKMVMNMANLVERVANGEGNFEHY